MRRTPSPRAAHPYLGGDAIRNYRQVTRRRHKCIIVGRDAPIAPPVWQRAQLKPPALLGQPQAVRYWLPGRNRNGRAHCRTLAGCSSISR